MVDVVRHHARVLGALATELLPDAEVSFDPGRLHELVRAPAGGLISIEPDSLELEDAERVFVGLSLTLTRESLDAESGLWALSADCSALWSLLRRAAGRGVSYSYDGGAVSGHTGEEWLELVNLESYFWRSGVESPPRPALRNAVTSLRLAVVGP